MLRCLSSALCCSAKGVVQHFGCELSGGKVVGVEICEWRKFN